MLLPNLTVNNVYAVQMSSGAKSIYLKDYVYQGELSPVTYLHLQEDCGNGIVTGTHVDTAKDTLGSGILAAGICVGVAVFLTIIVVIIWR